MELMQAQPLYKQAYEAIKRSIISGEFASGSKLVVSQLTEKFQVSRTPLREALRQLENEGLLIQDKMGATVITLNQIDFEELCECRLVLEKQMVQLIIYKITEEELSTIDSLLNEVEMYLEEEDHLKTLELNAKFHGILIKVCPNKRLVGLLEHVRSMLLLYRANIIRGSLHNQEISKEHRKIFEAIRSRDLNEALECTENHLLNDKRRGMKMFLTV